MSFDKERLTSLKKFHARRWEADCTVCFLLDVIEEKDRQINDRGAKVSELAVKLGEERQRGRNSSDDLTSYQSEETAWRYYSKLGRIESEIKELDKRLAEARNQFDYLLSNPPLYKCFNWSA